MANGVTIIVAGEDKTGEVFKAVQQHLADTKTAAKSTSESLGQIGNVLQAGLAGAGLTLGLQQLVGGFKSVVSSTMETAVQIGHLSEQTGISTQNLSVLRYAAQATGVDFDVLTRGFKKLAVTTYDADNGNKKAAQGFAQLGITVGELRAKGDDMYGVLSLIAQKFHDMPDGIVKSDTAAKMFGARMGAEMIPVLDELGGKMDELQAQAEAMGIVWDESGIKKMEELHRQAEILTGTFEGLKMEITSDLAPAMEAFMDWLSKGIHKNVEEAKNLGDTWKQVGQIIASAASGNYGAAYVGVKNFSMTGQGAAAHSAGQGPTAPRPMPPTDDPAAAQKLLLADRTAFAELQRSHQLTTQEEIDFWQKRIKAFQSGSAEYLDVLNEINRLTTEAQRKDQEEQKQIIGAFVSESIEDARRAKTANEQISDAITGTWEKGLNDEKKAAEQTAESALAQINANTKIQEASIEHDRLSKSISESAATQQKATVTANQYAAQIKVLTDELQQLEEIGMRGGNTEDERTKILNQITGLKGDAAADAMIAAPIQASNNELEGEGEKIAHAVFDPLFNLNESWNKKWKQTLASLKTDLGQFMEGQLFGALFGDPNGRGGKGWTGTSFKGDTSRPGLEGAGLLGGLMGNLFKKPATAASNGGLGTGAGTIPDATASMLQMGAKGVAGTGGIQVILNNNGAPMQVDQTSQSGGDGGEQQVIQIMLKQLETNGPVAQGIGGIVAAAGML